MKKNRGKSAIWLTLCIILMLQIPTVAYASTINEKSFSSGDLPSDSIVSSLPGVDESSGNVPDSSGDVKITGYTIYGKDGVSRIQEISKGQQIILYVTIAENRQPTFSYEPNAVLNTASFRAVSVSSKGDAKYVSSDQSGKYTLIFTCQYTGIGNTFGFDLSYPNSDIEMKYISINLNQCIEYVEPEVTPKPEATPTPEITVKGTGFAVKSLHYGSETIYAGSSFELQLILLATKGDYALEDVSVSLVLPAQLASADGHMVRYMGTVQPGNEIETSFLLSSDVAAEQGSYPITMNIRGMNGEDGEQVTSSVEITIPVKQSERFEISKLSLPTQLNAVYDDGQGYTTIYFINKGKTPIYNITVSVEGDHLSVPDGIVFFGNLDPGTQGSVDCNLVAKETGTLTGNISLVYENAQGITNEVQREFTVEAGMGETVGNTNDGPINVDVTKENAVPAWIWIAIGMAAVLLWSGIRYFIGKKRVEQIALLEEGTPDDNF